MYLADFPEAVILWVPVALSIHRDLKRSLFWVKYAVSSSCALPMPSRKPYSGSTRKLVIALDVGTTYSGISYSVLEPGEVSEILPVTR